MRRYKVLVSPAARRMLSEHVFFLARVSRQAAEKLRKTVLDELRTLETMPERFPRLEPENRNSAYRKLVIGEHYLLIYVIEEDTVYVEYMLDCRADNAWLLK